MPTTDDPLYATVRYKVLYARSDIAVVSYNRQIRVLTVGDMPDSEREARDWTAQTQLQKFMDGRCSVKPNEQTWRNLTDDVRAAWRQHA